MSQNIFAKSISNIKVQSTQKNNASSQLKEKTKQRRDSSQQDNDLYLSKTQQSGRMYSDDVIQKDNKKEREIREKGIKDIEDMVFKKNQNSIKIVGKGNQPEPKSTLNIKHGSGNKISVSLKNNQESRQGHIDRRQDSGQQDYSARRRDSSDYREKSYKQKDQAYENNEHNKHRGTQQISSRIIKDQQKKKFSSEERYSESRTYKQKTGFEEDGKKSNNGRYSKEIKFREDENNNFDNDEFQNHPRQSPYHQHQQYSDQNQDYQYNSSSQEERYNKNHRQQTNYKKEVKIVKGEDKGPGRKIINKPIQKHYDIRQSNRKSSNEFQNRNSEKSHHHKNTLLQPCNNEQDFNQMQSESEQYFDDMNQDNLEQEDQNQDQQQYQENLSLSQRILKPQRRKIEIINHDRRANIPQVRQLQYRKPKEITIVSSRR